MELGITKSASNDLASKKWRSPRTISLKSTASAQPQSTKRMTGKVTGLSSQLGGTWRGKILSAG